MQEQSTYKPLSAAYYLGLWLILGLLGIWCNHYLIGPPRLSGWSKYLLRYFLFYTAFVSYFYIFLEVILVRLYEQRYWARYLAWWLLILILLNISLIGLDVLLAFDDLMIKPSFLSPNYLNIVLGSSIVLSLAALPFRLAKDRSKGQLLQLQYKHQQVQGELKLLKAKLNPHFLLNTLNNIYSLIELKSPKAGPMILKLSGIMRYMLYETRGELVPLIKELNYIQQYLDLQQLKKDGQYNITFKIEGQVDGIQIEPMFFIPFFENAFKHGNLDALGNAWIKGRLTITDNNLNFLLENTCDPMKKRVNTSGSSLKMTRHRLQFRYPDRHELTIRTKEGLFQVFLHLTLSIPKPSTP